MPATKSGGINNCFSIEPHRALLTPSASPSLPPPDRPPTKRPRHRSTPSSSISATPSASNESSSSVDVNSARRASTLRVLNVWAQLAERYNKRLDEDDIVDLYSGAIIKDRGVVKGATRDYHIGHFAQPEGDPDADQDQEDSEQDDDDNEPGVLPSSEATTDEDAPISKKELLRGVPPLSATTDAEDLREFLEAEKQRRELAGDDEDDEELSPERLSAIRKALEEESRKEEVATANQVQEETSAEEHQVVTTPKRPSACVPLLDDESEDELALWTHDESTAVYPIARDESEQDACEVVQEVVEVTELDSDEEFKAILTRPPRFTPVSPLPFSRRKEPRQLPQFPPDSERGATKSRRASPSKVKSTPEVTPKPQNRPRSPLSLRKHVTALSHKGKASVSKETGDVSSDDEGLDEEMVTPIPPAHKGKGQEIESPIDDNNRDKTPKSLGVVSRGRKRKRIPSSTNRTNGDRLEKSPAKTKNSMRSRGTRKSQSPTILPQPDGPELSLDEDVSTPVRFVGAIPGPSTFSAASKNQQSTLSTPSYRSLDSVQPTSQSFNVARTLPTAITHPYSRRHPSYPPSIFSPNQATPGPSQGHLPPPPPPPPPMDSVQTQQAHYLLAQAMQQLSYLISSMPPYAVYRPNSGQTWHHAPLPPPHAAYSTPIHHTPHFHGARPYHTPSSSVPPSGLPPSSPVRSSVSPPVEKRRAQSRVRSKSRGRRVSFELDNQVTRQNGKQKAAEESDDVFRLEDRDSPPKEVPRGRTPGPPSRKQSDLSRGRSPSRR